MLNVLIVDDDASIREMISIALRSKYKVDSFSSGENALIACSEKDYDIAFTDVSMPHMDGIEFSHKMSIVSPKTRIVFVTGLPDSVPKDNPSKVIAKPFVLKEIMNECDELLREMQESDTDVFEVAE